MSPMAHIVKSNGLNIISYADNTQLIPSLKNDPSTTRNKCHSCMQGVAEGMKDNCLKLNTDSPEVLIFRKGSATHWNDAWWPSELGPTSSPPNTCNLIIILDSKLSMKK